MSYHIIHILHHGSYVSVDKGFLVLKCKDYERRAPISEVLCVIVSARGVSFSSNSLSELIKNGAVVIHCDEHYKPIGKTIGLSHIVHTQIFQRQVERQGKFADELWEKILYGKVENQAYVLDYISVAHPLWKNLEKPRIDEGGCARLYWGLFFSSLKQGGPHRREKRFAEHPINYILNYAYAVMGGIVHRSIVAHGLNPSLGIHHKYKYRADPLLYDLMEPLRPFCDLFLYISSTQEEELTIDKFAKDFSKKFVETRIKMSRNIKVLDAIDRYISLVAECFYRGNTKPLEIPKIKDLQL
ncbi:MAG: type II CRISPR-associated endonuclease Cas1 [Candidatus Hydrogenedentes bacterium]|nr:type II CRISPR-associated endonuclease Cas1 [Candidatus Hydrogenedentota bacterium]